MSTLVAGRAAIPTDAGRGHAARRRKGVEMAMALRPSSAIMLRACWVWESSASGRGIASKCRLS